MGNSDDDDDDNNDDDDDDNDNNDDDDDGDPNIVLQVVVTAGVLPEGKQGFSMPVVGGTLLGQEKGGVPKLVWEYILTFK